MASAPEPSGARKPGAGASASPGGGAPPPPASSRRDFGVLALSVLALIWGYNWVVMKIALEYSQPLMFAALRTSLGAACLFLVLVLTRRSLRPPMLGLTFLVGLLQTTGFVGLIMLALQTGGAGKVSVLAYTMPFWLLLLAWTFLGERLHGLQWLAVLLAFAGLVLVLSPWKLHGGLSSALAVAAGLSWAASAVVVKVMQRRRHVDLLSLTTWQMLLGSLPLLLIAALTYSGGPEWTGSFVWALAYNVVLANALAFVLWMFSLRRLSAGAAGMGTLATPVIGVAAAWIQLGERPAVGEAAGMVCIISALALVSARGFLAGRRTEAGRRADAVPLPPES